ncbi:MAG: hypothetical protein A2Z66_11930 [Chloroflexi bacterium RBG_13_66_10]|nr:MAG: hypothetical protein A2Z66_11930 [Chloroflexi bacterium RBG_13_66_10]
MVELPVEARPNSPGIHYRAARAALAPLRLRVQPFQAVHWRARPSSSPMPLATIHLPACGPFSTRLSGSRSLSRKW